MIERWLDILNEKGWPRPGKPFFKKCGSCNKLFCCIGKSTINPIQNCGYHNCTGGQYRNPTIDVEMTFSILNLPFICKNNKYGCEEILYETNLLEHEMYCDYQKINCPFLDKCTVDIGFLNCLDHFKKDHPSCATYGNGNIFNLPIDLTMVKKSI